MDGALLSGLTILKSHFPEGEWEKYYITEFVEEEALAKAVKNPQHLMLAQTAEWLEHSKNVVDGALKKLGMVSFKEFDAANDALIHAEILQAPSKEAHWCGARYSFGR